VTVADGRPGECDWIAFVSGPALLPISGVPAGWTSLTAEVVTSLRDGTVIETAPVSGTAPDVTVSLSGVQVAAIGSGVRWWRLLNAGVPVIVGRWVADASGADSTSAVSVTVAGGVVVTVQGSTGSAGVTDHGELTGLGDDDHTQYLTSGRHGAISGNPHATTAAHVGADPSGTAAAAIGGHVAGLDPHPQYLTTAEGSGLFDPVGTATAAVASHAGETTGVHGIADTALLATTAAVTAGDALKVAKAGDTMTGSLALTGEAALTVGGGSTATAVNSVGGVSAGYYVGNGTTNEWLLYRNTSPGVLYLRDMANSRMLVHYNAGASADAATIANNGRVIIGSNGDFIGTATLGVIATSPTRVGQAIRLTAAQTANAFEVQNSAGANLSWFTSSGMLNIGTAAGANALRVGVDGVYLRQGSAGRLVISPDAVNPATNGFTVTFRAPNGVLYEDGSGNNLMEVAPTGGIFLSNIATGGASAHITLNGSAAGGSNTIRWNQNGASNFWLGNFAGLNLRLVDVNNGSRDHARWIPGASSDLARSEFFARVDIGGGDLGAAFGITVTTTSRKGQIIRLAAAATAPGMEVQSSAGTVLAQINQIGGVYGGVANHSFGAASPGVGHVANKMVAIHSSSVSNTPLMLRGFTGQTAPLLEVQDPTGATLRSVLASGRDSYIAANTSPTVGAAGTADVLPLMPLGYIIADVAGTSVKIPYYTA